MDHRTQDNRYEQLYTNMREYTQQLHRRNKSRIKYGTIILILLPLILGTIRWLTNSDKTFFLLIWVFCMFLLSAYLIGVEYLDHSIRKKMEELTDREDDFGDLLEVDQKSSEIREKLRKRTREGGGE
ncbi:MAG: hypothetical protein IJJ21_04640 [Firmicutes bacterium]|nr:hypothetical protein [Bacillota bacterium]